MMNEHAERQPVYDIVVGGELDGRWQAWFEGLTLTPTGNGRTILSGPIRDQAALHGVLKKINNLGLTLISVNRRDLSSAEPGWAAH